MCLKHTGLWLTIEGLFDVADIDNDKVFDTKPSHSHPPHPTTKPPPIHPSSLSNSNPLPFAHSKTLPPLSFCTLFARCTPTTTLSQPQALKPATFGCGFKAVVCVIEMSHSSPTKSPMSCFSLRIQDVFCFTFGHFTAISPMLCRAQRCVSCHTVCLSFLLNLG